MVIFTNPNLNGRRNEVQHELAYTFLIFIRTDSDAQSSPPGISTPSVIRTCPCRGCLYIFNLAPNSSPSSKNRSCLYTSSYTISIICTPTVCVFGKLINMAHFQSEYDRDKTTDEFGNPIRRTEDPVHHGVTGATAGYGSHDTTGTGYGTHGTPGTDYGTHGTTGTGFGTHGTGPTGFAATTAGGVTSVPLHRSDSSSSVSFTPLDALSAHFLCS